jgi:hypothetical protein
MHRRFRTGLAALGLVLLAASLSACVVEEPGRPHGSWCYWHPYQCR